MFMMLTSEWLLLACVTWYSDAAYTAHYDRCKRLPVYSWQQCLTYENYNCSFKVYRRTTLNKRDWCTDACPLQPDDADVTAYTLPNTASGSTRFVGFNVTWSIDTRGASFSRPFGFLLQTSGTSVNSPKPQGSHQGTRIDWMLQPTSSDGKMWFTHECLYPIRKNLSNWTVYIASLPSDGSVSRHRLAYELHLVDKGNDVYEAVHMRTYHTENDDRFTPLQPGYDQISYTPSTPRTTTSTTSTTTTTIPTSTTPNVSPDTTASIRAQGDTQQPLLNINTVNSSVHPSVGESREKEDTSVQIMILYGLLGLLVAVSFIGFSVYIKKNWTKISKNMSKKLAGFYQSEDFSSGGTRILWICCKEDIQVSKLVMELKDNLDSHKCQHVNIHKLKNDREDIDSRVLVELEKCNKIIVVSSTRMVELREAGSLDNPVTVALRLLKELVDKDHVVTVYYPHLKDLKRLEGFGRHTPISLPNEMDKLEQLLFSELDTKHDELVGEPVDVHCDESVSVVEVSTLCQEDNIESGFYGSLPIEDANNEQFNYQHQTTVIKSTPNGFQCHPTLKEPTPGHAMRQSCRYIAPSAMSSISSNFTDSMKYINDVRDTRGLRRYIPPRPLSAISSTFTENMNYING